MEARPTSRGKDETAAKIRRAVDLVLADPSVTTPDIHGSGTTESYKNAIIAHLA